MDALTLVLMDRVESAKNSEEFIRQIVETGSTGLRTQLAEGLAYATKIAFDRRAAWLLALSQDPELSVRSAAVSALTRMHDSEAITLEIARDEVAGVTGTGT